MTTFKQYDTPTLTRELGSINSLESVDRIKIYVQHAESGSLVVNDTVDSYDAEDMTVEYQLTQAQTGRVGRHDVEFVVHYTDGRVLSSPATDYVTITSNEPLDREVTVDPADPDPDISVTNLDVDAIYANSGSLITYHDPIDMQGNEVQNAGGVAEDPHALGGSSHSASTLADLNALVSDATLDDATAERPPTDHAIAGADHTASTLADLNALVSDATLDNATDSRPPESHAIGGSEHSGSTLADINALVTDATLAALSDLYTDSDAQTAVEGNVDAADLIGSSGTAGQILETDGSQLSWVEPPSAPVSSVFGRTGDVTAQSGDYALSEIGNVDVSALLEGTRANRPAAGTAGRWYHATDERIVYRDDGSSWVPIAGNPVYATLSDVPSNLPEGMRVWVQDEQAIYVEDGT